jgi:hypothetical protein
MVQLYGQKADLGFVSCLKVEDLSSIYPRMGIPSLVRFGILNFVRQGLFHAAAFGMEFEG